MYVGVSGGLVFPGLYLFISKVSLPLLYQQKLHLQQSVIVSRHIDVINWCYTRVCHINAMHSDIAMATMAVMVMKKIHAS